MAYQKRCIHDSKVTETINQVYIEKDNIKDFYKSPKNMFNNTHVISFEHYLELYLDLSLVPLFSTFHKAL